MNNPYNPQQGQPQPGYPQQGYPQPGYPQPGYPQPGYPQPGYEFSSTEEKTISRTSTWAKAVAILFFIQVGFAAINFNIIGLAIDLAIGIAVWKGAKSMQTVVETQGNDIPHMMEALSQLSSAFTIRLVIVAIAAGLLGLIGGVAMLIVLAAG